MSTKYYPKTLNSLLKQVKLSVPIVHGRPLPEFSAEGELLFRDKARRICSKLGPTHKIIDYHYTENGDCMGYNYNHSYSSKLNASREIAERIYVRPEFVGVAVYNPDTQKSDMELFCDIETARKKHKIGETSPEAVEFLKTHRIYLDLLGDASLPDTSRYGDSFNPIYSPETIKRVKDSIQGAKKWNYANTGKHYRDGDRLSLSNYGSTALNTHKIKLPLIVEKHPDNINGIIIFQMECLVSWPEPSEPPVWDFNVVSYYEVIPGKNNSKAWKVLKRGPVEKDFEMLMDISCPSIWFDGCFTENASTRHPMTINSRAKHREVSSNFGSNELYEFFKEFPNFTKMTGFEEAALVADYNTISFFIRYCYLISTYPVIEQLIKMGYWSVFTDVLQATKEGSNKSKKEYFKSLSRVIDENATSGKKGIKLPSYISNYISSHSCAMKEMIAWLHLYEATNISKENFETLVNSSYFKLLQIKLYGKTLVEDLARIAVFGYEPSKTLTYIVKQSQKYSIQLTRCFTDLIDYANMCDVMDIVPDMYPDNIHKVHNSMSVQFNAYKNAALDGNIAEIRDKLLPALNYVEQLKTYKESDFVIRIPGNSYDIISEGQQQRNCVGSYVRSVAEGKSIVFFIREKDAPEASYVTAEYRNGTLTQCYYAANRYVPGDAKEREIATFFVNELKRRGITTK